ncbi:hypothetical protein ACWOEH_09040 [Enterococcus nangangensis]
MKKIKNKSLFRMGAFFFLSDLFLTLFTQWQTNIILPALGILLMIKSFDEKAKKDFPKGDERDELLVMKVNSVLLTCLVVVASGVIFASLVIENFSLKGTLAHFILVYTPVAWGILLFLLLGSILLELFYERRV